MADETRTIKTDYLARVEGEGGMLIRLKGSEIEEVKLNIFEPPRFFEAFLRGRYFAEAPDITARICGICPVAYQMAASHSMEAICGAKVEGQLNALRRLLYCGEWIESHALHVYMLHAPDFLKLPSAIEIAAVAPEVVEKALRLKKIGNHVMTVVGGREIHPINVRVGGFYRTPSKAELEAMVPDLEWALETSVETVKWANTLDFPDFEMDYEFLALDAGGVYPIEGGDRFATNRGLNAPLDEFYDHVAEDHVQHANALHGRMRERGSYLTGPMARYALWYDLLGDRAKAAAEEIGLPKEVKNPYKSILVRSVELVEACSEALRIIGEYEQPAEPAVEVTPRAGVACGASEAPRGTLCHRYRIDDTGIILDATITPPTAQNQPQIEADLRGFVSKFMDLPHDELTLRCEQAIRNYDPCISCATHFLNLEIERT
jgi:coenzyme F420-reducing hydrogenase alpha subunit